MKWLSIKQPTVLRAMLTLLLCACASTLYAQQPDTTAT